MAISFGVISGLSGAVSPLSFALAIGANETVVAGCGMIPTTVAVSGITDDAAGGSSAYAQRAALVNAAGVKGELWSTLVNGSKAAANLADAMSGVITDANILAATYRGAVAIGQVVAAQGTGTINPSIAITTQDPNNWVVAFFVFRDASPTTALTGTLRLSDANVSIADALVDNTAAAAGLVTCAVTHGTSDWVAVAIELRTASSAASARRKDIRLFLQAVQPTARRKHRKAPKPISFRAAGAPPPPSVAPRFPQTVVASLAVRTATKRRHRFRPMESGLLLVARLVPPAPPLPPPRRCIVSAGRAATIRRHHPTTSVTTRRPTAMFVPGPAVKPRVTQFLVGDPLRASQRRHRRQRHETAFGLGARPTAKYTPVLVYPPEIDLRPKRVRRSYN